MTHVRQNWEHLVHYTTECEHCILADDFILQRTIDFAKFVAEDNNILMIHNTKAYVQGRKAIQLSQDEFDDNLIQSLNNNKRVVNPSSSRNLNANKHIAKDPRQNN